MVWQIFQKRKPCSLGLDISKSNVKLVYIKPQDNAFAIYHTLEHSITPSKKKEENPTQYAIQQLIAQLDTRYKKVSSALSDHLSLSLTLSLDIAADIKTAALLTAAPLLPIPLDTLYFDYQILEKTKSKQHILIVFCKKEIVNHHKELIQSSGLDLRATELKSHALERSYRALYNLTKYPNSWSSILVNQDNLTVLLWEKEKLLTSFSSEITSSDSLEKIITQIYQHLMRLLGMYSQATLKALWVVGDHPFCETIQEEVRKTLKLLKHPTSIYKNEESAHIEKIGNAFYVALGLALRNL